MALALLAEGLAFPTRSSTDLSPRASQEAVDVPLVVVLHGPFEGMADGLDGEVQESPPFLELLGAHRHQVLMR